MHGRSMTEFMIDVGSSEITARLYLEDVTYQCMKT
jgi:hypothetical protein